MSKAKHRNYRHVVKQERIDLEVGKRVFQARVVYVLHRTEYRGANKATLASLERKGRVFADRLNIHVYCKGMQGFYSAYLGSRNQGRVVNLNSPKVDALLKGRYGDYGASPKQAAINDWWQAFVNTLRGVEGTVRYQSGRAGAIDCEYGMVHFYTCNVKGADSFLKQGQRVRFDGMEQLGAVNIEVLPETMILKNIRKASLQELFQALEYLIVNFSKLTYGEQKAQARMIRDRAEQLGLSLEDVKQWETEIRDGK